MKVTDFLKENNSCVVYKLYFKHTDKFYIGCTRGLVRRMFDHYRDLSLGESGNYKLQEEYNKGDIYLEIIEYVDDIRILKDREDYYIRTLKPVLNIAIKHNLSRKNKLPKYTRKNLKKRIVEVYDNVMETTTIFNSVADAAVGTNLAMATIERIAAKNNPEHRYKIVLSPPILVHSKRKGVSLPLEWTAVLTEGEETLLKASNS